MADPINRLAMFSAPVDDQVNMLAPQLPPGHPSNMLMWIRDQIPQVQADDSSTMSGIYSRLGRTATAIPRAGLETMANWLRGVDDPNAVRIGEDTIAPLGLFGMAGLAGRGATAAKVMADNAKSSVPGTVVQAMGDRSLTELTDAPPRFRPDRAVAATENNPYVVRQGGRDGTNYFALDDTGQPIGYATATTHPIGVKIEGVEVAKGHRGQGVASNLYDTIEQATGQPVRPSGLLTDDSLRLWQSRDPEAVQWHQSLPSEPGWNYSPRELKRMADDRGHVGAREAFDRLPPEARTPERLATMFADNAKSSVPGTVVNAMGEQPQTIRAYHGTNAKFDRFDPAYTDEVGFHFGSKEQAEARLRDKADEEGRRRLPWPLSNERTIPVDIEAKKILDLKEDPNSFGGDLLSLRLLLDEHMPRAKYDEVQSMVKAGRDAEATAAVRQWITDNGYDVVRYPNKVEGAGAQPSYMTMGTGNVRDARTGKVLFSDQASSAPGLAANATQEDNPVLDILSKYGLTAPGDVYSPSNRMQLGGPGSSLKTLEPSSVKKTVFAGTKSATADQAALAEAKELKAINESPEEILRTTGWFQREDGVWRNEIDDSQSKLKALVDRPGERKLSEILDHPDLFAAYPNLKDVRLVFSNMKDLSGQASTSPMADFRAMEPWTRWGKKDRLVRINLNSIQNKDPRTARDIILHEVQHAIQDIEGDLNQGVMNRNAFVPYRERLYEREGFEAQGRAGLTKSERRNSPPSISRADDGVLSILSKYGLY